MFKRIDSLRFWCNKILPLVYDDSLSYYETLCKVVSKLNALIENNEKLPSLIAELLSDDKLKVIMSDLFNQLESQIAKANEGISKTATEKREIGELVWLNGCLYKIIHDMIAGDQYVSGSNCTPVTIEDMIKNVYYPSQELLLINAVIGGEANVELADTHTYSASSQAIIIKEV